MNSDAIPIGAHYDLYILFIDRADVSPANYVSSDGESFPLVKGGVSVKVERERGEKRRERKYRGATEEIVEGTRMRLSEEGGGRGVKERVDSVRREGGRGEEREKT